MTKIFLTLVIALAMVGCGLNRPIVAQDEHYNKVGAAAVERDISHCMKIADAVNADSKESDAEQAQVGTAGDAGVNVASGAEGSAAVAAASGSAAGASGGATTELLHWLSGLTEHNPPFVNLVNTCLQHRGHQTVSWN